jgi:hypothetical protein
MPILVLLFLMLFSVTVTAHEKHNQSKPVQSAPLKQESAPPTTAPAEEYMEEQEGEKPGFKERIAESSSQQNSSFSARIWHCRFHLCVCQPQETRNADRSSYSLASCDLGCHRGIFQWTSSGGII